METTLFLFRSAPTAGTGISQSISQSLQGSISQVFSQSVNGVAVDPGGFCLCPGCPLELGIWPDLHVPMVALTLVAMTL